MFDRFRTFNHDYGVDTAALILRLGLAPIFLYDGLLKVLMGGNRWHTDLDPVAQMSVAWGEVAIGAALVVGFLTRLAGLGVIAIMIGAIVVRAANKPLWEPLLIPGYENKEMMLRMQGYELMLNFLCIMVALALAMKGPGRFAVDHLVFRRWRRA